MEAFSRTNASMRCTPSQRVQQHQCRGCLAGENGDRMRSRWPALAVLLGLAGCSTTGSPGEGDGGAQAVPALRKVLDAGTLALVNASVLEPATGVLDTGRTVLVSGDRIDAVGPDGTVVLPP